MLAQVLSLADTRRWPSPRAVPRGAVSALWPTERCSPEVKKCTLVTEVAPLPDPRRPLRRACRKQRFQTADAAFLQHPGKQERSVRLRAR